MEDINLRVAELGKLNYLHFNVRSSIPNDRNYVFYIVYTE